MKYINLRKFLLTIALSLLLSHGLLRTVYSQTHGLSYPDTPALPIVEMIHGKNISDPYRWLELEDSDEIREWEKAQNTLTAEYLSDVPNRDILESRLFDLIDVPWVGSPVIQNGRAFYHAQPKGAQKDILYWRGRDDTERVLIDPNTHWNIEGDGADKNIALGRWSVTRDGKTIAYVSKPNNADEGWIDVMDVESGRISEIDRLENIKHSRIEWTIDSKGFYYTLLPKGDEISKVDRPGLAEIRYHKLGTPQSSDTLVFPATNNPTTFLRPKVSWNGRWLFVYVWKGWTGVSVMVRDLHSDNLSFRTFYESDDAQIWVFDHGEYLYIHTNEDAPNKKLLRVKAGIFDQNAWEEVIAESPSAVLQDVYRSRDHLLTVKLENAHNSLAIHDTDGKKLRDINLPSEGSTHWVKVNPDDDDIYYTFSSFTHPYSTYHHDILTGSTSLWSLTNVPMDIGRYKSTQEWFVSKDGTKIPMFLVRDPSVKLDGSAPLLLYGYGGFGISLKPWFWASIQPWFEAGGILAVPNLRGGGEFGKDWHQAGMRLNKQNTFDDSIAAAEFLIEKGYTNPLRLAIRGRSNGGLLVGAVVTQRPELFGAAICGVPLTDMVRYTEFGVGKTWIEEYGDPNLAEDFENLNTYSPYHHVKKNEKYPPMLITTADTDDRVHPGHARKFAAAMQAANPDNNLVLLYVEEQAGHSGGGRTDDKVRNWSIELRFLMKQFGLKPAIYKE